MDYKIIAGGVSYISENDLREALGVVDEYVDILGTIRKLREERDELKEKCDNLKRRFNAAYGVSCGYSASKEPAFRCNVISYSGEFDSMLDSGCSIHVELDLIPNANYKGIFDPEDLRQYINKYGREKKLGIIESVDYQNAKTARAELAYLYKTVLGKERLDTDLSPHEVMKAILDEYKRVVHDFEERTSDWSNVRREFDRYKLAVGSLLGIPIKARDDINAIERSFEFSKKKYESLKEFRDSVCDTLDIPSNMTDEQILKEIHDIANRYDELEDLRADICGALDLESMTGTPQQNDKKILETVEDLLCDYEDSAKALKVETEGYDVLRKNAIEDLKNRGFFFRPEADETLREIFIKLLKCYDDYFSRYKEQFGLRQEWHIRYESEHERANGEHKRAEKALKKVRDWTARCDSLERALNNRANEEIALEAFRNECRKLRKEKFKVINTLGQDTWDDCVK